MDDEKSTDEKVDMSVADEWSKIDPPNQPSELGAIEERDRYCHAQSQREYRPGHGVTESSQNITNPKDRT